MSASPSLPKLAVLPDFPEEDWPSMDLVAEMLLKHLAEEHSSEIAAMRVCPNYRRSLRMRNVDRALNRFWFYPQFVRRVRDSFDFFHVCDHSYAQLVHELPSERTGVFCHDLDTFRCLLEPERHPRPRWFRAMMQRTLRGLQRARLIFHSTDEIGRQLAQLGIVDSSRLVKAALGIAPEFCSSETRAPLPENLDGTEYILHVGSCIERKRIDVLLDVFAQLHSSTPTLRLVKLGDPWTGEQQRQIEVLDIGNSITHLARRPRGVVAELYRQARIVLMTSEAEGFGLPVVEALACGAPVVASDIPALRETGGDAALYAPVGDVDEFVMQCRRILDDTDAVPSPAARLAQADRYSWSAHASIILHAYLKL